MNNLFLKVDIIMETYKFFPVEDNGWSYFDSK